MKKIKILLAAIVLLTAASTLKAQTPEQMLEKLGVELFKPVKPAANYTRAVQSGNLVFLAGHGPLRANGTSIKGRLGEDLTLEEGQEAARIAAISLLSTLKEEIGDLSRVKRIVKVTGMVNCTADFYDQSKVINGCSDLLVEVFGEKGKHARAAVGMVSLPFNIAVEIEMIVEIK